ncbi:hypothetical protein CANTEDRAFT_123899 [Yamadazyma tenuis ATCC 10573]|uniref:Lysophospholipase NTE1 n=1 Tax=Candida tenuis (strain ATCC 10573 / BCRC 21748 / CBS 615 / JCM 9827 / NBRC 10315 / NRRL Y-1498 / VKM Y-70) TaxID=590646 RepID=G3B9Y2_CANTC|nr:patatin-domain-containing protein [Yamadazyma tenuis ATCC 10573]XP_006689118.1 uncharacterized protein CANTEDRAFT_123899 [Yamadazyma tenuis ATCC 10573]EGV62947.1 patatin-domain-containing protein [Yamadazyma tenuis ATCC 10573]EGV62948.1 hypothetical protein CANTEDRAFT_123899 [Yamadazyma tenuis ATCC 10573]
MSYTSLGALFSTSFQVTLSLRSILVSILFIAITSAFLIRYKYLTRFTKNPEPQLISKDVKKDEIVDSINKKKRKNLKTNSNYLDEFLSAIKIFGYLERPVFHELTKNMTTQKLSWDELLYLDEKLGFSIVVDGSVQIFIKMNEKNDSDFQNLKDLDNDTPEILIMGNQRYQLLNEIKSGVPLSTLNSTLDLFKSSVTQWLDGEPAITDSISSSSSLDLNLSGNQNSPKANGKPEHSYFEHSYPDIIVRPKSSKKNKRGATIAIIPASAFQRIHFKYPKATAHIVTMVKNRLFKVTMNTIHNYLGLSDEIIDSEVKLNSSIDSSLPDYLKNTLVEKYSNRRGSLNEHKQSSSSSMEKLTKKKTAIDLRTFNRQSSSRLVSLSSVAKPSHPGDLLSSVPISRKSVFNLDDYNSRFKDTSGKFSSLSSTETTFSNDIEETEETSTRIAVVENMFKLLGIDGNSPFLKRTESIPIASRLGSFPKIYSTINQSQLAQYNNSLNGTESKGVDSLLEGIQRPKAVSISNGSGFDFDSVKDDFAKNLKIKYFEPGKIVIEQNSFNSGLYYVIDGSLDVECNKASGRDNKIVTVKRGSIPQGGLGGYLSSILGIKALTTLKASSKGVILACIHKYDWARLMDKYYQLQLPLACRYKSLLSKEILTIDFALEWCHIQAGDVLAAEGDQANGFHIILSGRFRVVQSKSQNSTKDMLDGNGKIGDEFNVLGEYGHGESIGEVEVLTASRRATSLIAVRDSETARIPRTLFEILSSQNPSIMVKVSRIVAAKVASAQNDLRIKNSLSSTITVPQTNSSTPFQSPSSHISGNYKTITVLPTVNGLPVREFATKLVNSLEIIGRKVIALDQSTILTHLGRHAFDDSLSQLKLSGFFATLEEEYETIVYICDSTVRSSWTSTCISQGDCILLLANAQDYDVAVSVGEFEKLLIKYRTTARTDLCLLHPEKFVPYGSTSIWLKDRNWVQGHHHIQMTIANSIGNEPLKKKSIIEDIALKISERTNQNIKQRFEIVRSRLSRNSRLNKTEKASTAVEPYKNDFLRLARILSNEAIGLVLGGGGARGISHLGVVTALERHGIPVDIIGGTSIGSFVGGLYGLEYNSVSIYGKVKKFAKRVSSYWLSLFDLTLPVTSYLSGYEFNRGIWKVLGFSELEDSWIKFYCNSTNITNSTMDIHEYGIMWRFIRASMSLAGLLPPIAYNGCMLLDGGYLDNLPVLEMKRRGAKYIMAVDVGSVDDRSPMNYGDTLSGIWVVFNRWNPFSKHPNVPNMMDIQSRLAYVASVNALEIAKRTPGVYYMRPPIEEFGTLDFGKFEVIYKVGLDYAEEILTQWENEGKLPKIVGRIKHSGTSSSERPGLFRRNSL